jgi:hypothetical protein
VSERKVPFFCKESRDQDMKGVVDGRYWGFSLRSILGKSLKTTTSKYSLEHSSMVEWEALGPIPAPNKWKDQRQINKNKK